MIDDDGNEWAVAVLREREGLSAWEYHRHYNQEAARSALREEHRRIGRGIVKTKAAHLVRRQVGQWETVSDDDD